MSEAAEAIWGVIAGVILAAVYVFVYLSVGALCVLLAWNVGVIGLAAALGLTVGTIGFWTGFGAYALVGLLKNLLGTQDPVNLKQKLKV